MGSTATLRLGWVIEDPLISNCWSRSSAKGCRLQGLDPCISLIDVPQRFSEYPDKPGRRYKTRCVESQIRPPPLREVPSRGR
jgi:hypothetical protein